MTRTRVLVTGAASGIGYETARALARHGAEVLVADVDADRGERAVAAIAAASPSAPPRFVPLDLASLDTVRQFAAQLVRKAAPLDVLVNNAGIQGLSTRRETVDGFELTFGIGHLGHFALAGQLLPLLLKAAAPRVVTVSSIVHGSGHLDWDDLQMKRGYDSQRAYNQTKLANLLFALELQRRADSAGWRLGSIAAHPGVARTGIAANRRRLGRLSATDRAVGLVIRLAFALPFVGHSASAGAGPVIYAATSPQAEAGGFYGPGGIGEMTGPPSPARIRPPALDLQVAARLWEVSEQLTGVNYADCVQP